MNEAPTVPCPQCGAPVTVDRRFAHMAVCASCRSVVTFGEAAAEVAGTMSALPATPSRLFVGATGRVEGQPFRVVGRVRYGYQRGYWDEWALSMADGATRWLSEDEGELELEAEVPVDEATLGGGEALPAAASLTPGASVIAAGRAFRVVERDTAFCEGGEGQLPFVLVQGDRVPFADLRGGGSGGSSVGAAEVGTLEDLPDGTRLYLGRALAPTELVLDATRQELGLDETIPVAAKADAGDGRRARVTLLSGDVRAVACSQCGGGMEVETRAGVPSAVRCPYCGNVEALQPQEVACPSCGERVPVRGGGEAATATCPRCDTLLNVRGSAPTVLRRLAQTRPATRPPLPLGSSFRWEGTDYEVTGWIRYRGDEGEDVYTYDELLLFAPQAGYAWLEISDGHVSLGRKVYDGPALSSPEEAGTALRYRGARYRVVETGEAEIIHVEGELPWVAQVGDRVQLLDAVRGDERLEGEWSGTEAEWFLAKYVPRRAFLRAAGGAAELPPAQGVAPHQPYSRAKAQALWILLLLAAAAVGVAVWLGSSGRTIGRWRWGAELYGPQGATTEAFPSPLTGEVDVRVELAGARDQWAYVRLTLVRDGGEALGEASAQVARYEWDGEQRGAWVQEVRLAGPRGDGARWRVVGHGRAGRVWTSPELPPPTPSLSITVRAPPPPIGWFLLYALVLAVGILWLLLSRAAFALRKRLAEADRGEADEDDDWDDDWDDDDDAWDDD